MITEQQYYNNTNLGVRIMPYPTSKMTLENLRAGDHSARVCRPKPQDWRKVISENIYVIRTIYSIDKFADDVANKYRLRFGTNPFLKKSTVFIRVEYNRITVVSGSNIKSLEDANTIASKALDEMFSRMEKDLTPYNFQTQMGTVLSVVNFDESKAYPPE